MDEKQEKSGSTDFEARGRRWRRLDERSRAELLNGKHIYIYYLLA